MADAMTAAKKQLQDAGQSCADMAASTADTVKNAASYVSDQARDAAKQAACAGSYIEQKAQTATEAIGSGLMSAGEAVRQNGPHDGRLGQTSSAVAQTLSDTGDYVKRKGLDGMAQDTANLIKKNPLPALLIGIGLGFLSARAFQPRS